MAGLIHHSIRLACVTCLVALLSACFGQYQLEDIINNYIIIIFCSPSSAASLADLTGGKNNFTIYNNAGKPCLQASFQLNFYIYYKSNKGKEKFPVSLIVWYIKNTYIYIILYIFNNYRTYGVCVCVCERERDISTNAA